MVFVCFPGYNFLIQEEEIMAKKNIMLEAQKVSEEYEPRMRINSIAWDEESETFYGTATMGYFTVEASGETIADFVLSALYQLEECIEHL